MTRKEIEKDCHKEKKITQWHPAFYSAIKLELIDNKKDLTFQCELGLNSKPILIDLLVITKSPDIIIHNDIGKIFRGHNLFEYKSPNYALNIDTFYKGLAYACLYKSNGSKVDEIKANDITLTFVRDTMPQKMISNLRKAGYSIVKNADGIYYVSVPLIEFGIQIIVSSQLNKDEHVWLTSLTTKISKKNAESLVAKVSKLSAKDDKEWADSVLQVTMKQNPKVFEELKEGKKMCEALKELMRPEIEEEIEKAVEKAVKAAVKAAVKDKDEEIARLKAELEASKNQANTRANV